MIKTPSRQLFTSLIFSMVSEPGARKRRAFTLIEILIVLVILTLLMALLFPVFSSVRESGRRAQCSNNLRQIGMALSAYVADHNNRYPPPVNGNLTWVDALVSYTKSPEIFQCPNVPYGNYKPGGSANDESVGTPVVMVGYNGSYDLVTPLLTSKTTVIEKEDGGTITLGRIGFESIGFPAIRYRFPSSTFLALDSAQEGFAMHNIGAGVNPGEDAINNPDDLKKQGVTTRHRDGNNILFVDGHVKWLATNDLLKRGQWRPDGKDTPSLASP